MPRHLLKIRFMAATVLALCVAAGLAISPAGAATATATAPASEGQKFLDEALTLEKSGKYAAAAIQLKNAVTSDPNLLSARFELGMVYLRTGSIKLAQTELESVRAKGFDEGQVTLPLMRVYLARGNYRDILTKFDASRYSGNAQAAVLAMQVRAQVALQDLPAARSLATQALAQGPRQPLALIAGAIIARIDQEFAESEKLIDQGLAADPDNLELHVLKAEARTLAKDYESASRLLDRAAQNFPGNMRVRTARAVLNVLRNNPGALAEDVSAILKVEPRNPMGKYLKAVMLYRQERYGEVVMQLRTYTEILDQYPPAKYVLAAAALNDNQVQTALTYAEQYLNLAPADVLGSELLAAAAIRGKDAARAILVLEPLAKTHPGDNQLRIHLAAAYQSAGRNEDAAKLLIDGITADSSSKDETLGPALRRLRSGGAVVETARMQDLVQGNADSREYHRFIGGQLWGS